MVKIPEVEWVDDRRLCFEFTETEPDGGGRLVIRAWGAEWKESLCDMYRREEPKATKYAPLMDARAFVVELEPKDTRNYGRQAWYAFPIALDDEWFKPYKDLLQRCTGYAGEIPDMPIPGDTEALRATGYRAALRVEDGHLQATYYVESHAWGDRSALDYGHARAEDYFKESVGDRPPVPEFIHGGNGAYYPNPKYATGYKAPVRARVTSEVVWNALWAWWRANHATPAQERVLRQVEALKSDGNPETRRLPWECRWRQGVDYSLYALDPDGACDWDGKGKKARVYKWEEFAALK